MSSHRDARRAESAPRGRDGLDGSDRAASSQSPQPQPGDGAADDAVAILAPSRRDGRPSTAAPLAFESWGVHIVAMIVYWCCRALEESTDAFKKAAYVANAFWEEQVCGSGLAELLRHDTTRGVLLLSSVLPKLGSHASVLGALRSYVSAHGHEERPVASEEGVLSFPLSARDNAAHVTPEPQLGDGAAASAAAAAPLAFETWDFKGVATVVYRCCNAFAGDTDVFEKAAQVANAFWEAQVCGRALAELLHNDASRGDVLLAGVLSKLGSRAAVLGALRAYILEHGHEQWPVTSEAEKAKLSFPLSASRVEDRMTKYPWFKCSKSFDCFKPVACPGEFGKFVTTVGCLAENTFYTSRTEISATMPMPLLVTVNINELQEEIGNPDKVLMIGTLVIRSMFDTDTLVGVDGKQSPRPSLKVNGSEVTDEQLRLLSSEIEKIEGPDGFMRTTTYSLEVPTTRRNVFAKAPFNITSFQVALDFKPLVARLPNGKLIKFVPDLLCPTEDLRELISSKDEELDNLDKFDIINANPSVQVKLATTAKGMLHTPSIKITFYGDTDAVRAALNIIVPILFIAFGNVLNVWFSEDHDNFVANALTLGLTFVFFIPTLNQVESVSNELDLNQLLVVLIFLGLVLGCMDCKRCNGGTNHFLPLRFETLRSVVRATSFTLLWGSVLIPVLNLILYRRVKWRLRGAAYGRGRGFYSSGGSHLKGSWFTGQSDRTNFKYPYQNLDLAPFWSPKRKRRREDSWMNQGLNKKFESKPWRVEPDDRSFYCGPQAVDIPHTVPFNDAWEQKYNKAWEERKGRATFLEAVLAQFFEPFSIKAKVQRARFLEDMNFKAAVKAITPSITPFRKAMNALRKPFHKPNGRVHVEAAAADDDEFCTEDEVQVFQPYLGFKQGIIVAFDAFESVGTCSVLFCDGEFRACVMEETICKYGFRGGDGLVVGASVEARYEGKSKFYPGKIHLAKEDCMMGVYAVKYDGKRGDSEAAGQYESEVLGRLIKKTGGAPAAAPAAAPTAAPASAPDAANAAADTCTPS